MEKAEMMRRKDTDTPTQHILGHGTPETSCTCCGPWHARLISTNTSYIIDTHSYTHTLTYANCVSSLSMFISLLSLFASCFAVLILPVRRPYIHKLVEKKEKFIFKREKLEPSSSPVKFRSLFSGLKLQNMKLYSPLERQFWT